MATRKRPTPKRNRLAKLAAPIDSLLKVPADLDVDLAAQKLGLRPVQARLIAERQRVSAAIHEWLHDKANEGSDGEIIAVFRSVPLLGLPSHSSGLKGRTVGSNAVWAQEQAQLRQERRRKLNELVGRLVRLTHDIVVQDGDAVRRGHVLRVKSHQQGRYMLVDPATDVLLVSGVVRPSFELVEGAA